MTIHHDTQTNQTTACGLRNAERTSTRESSVTCLDCLAVLDAAPRRCYRTHRLIVDGITVVARIELVGGSYKVLSMLASVSPVSYETQNRIAAVLRLAVHEAGDCIGLDLSPIRAGSRSEEYSVCDLATISD